MYPFCFINDVNMDNSNHYLSESFAFSYIIIVSESDILCPNDHFSYIENFVSFERALFEDCSFRNRTQIFQ